MEIEKIVEKKKEEFHALLKGQHGVLDKVFMTNLAMLYELFELNARNAPERTETPQEQEIISEKVNTPAKKKVSKKAKKTTKKGKKE